jgi:hypothetical protein
MKQVWILMGSDTETPWIEAVFIDKVLAEANLRHLKGTDDGRGYIFWIQEKEITKVTNLLEHEAMHKAVLSVRARGEVK